MDVRTVWEIISYAWTEIGIDETECQALVQKGGIGVGDLDEVDRLFYRDICASFAVDAFLVFPLMLWMLMPDWGYSDKYLRNRIARWYSRPYWVHFLNPLRMLGYPVALCFAWSYRAKLRRAVHAVAMT